MSSGASSASSLASQSSRQLALCEGRTRLWSYTHRATGLQPQPHSHTATQLQATATELQSYRATATATELQLQSSSEADSSGPGWLLNGRARLAWLQQQAKQLAAATEPWLVFAEGGAPLLKV